MPYCTMTGFHNPSSKIQPQFYPVSNIHLNDMGQMHHPVNQLSFKDLVHTPLLSHLFSLTLLLEI